MSESMTFGRVPQEVLDHIAYLSGTSDFLGPPAHLIPLVLTSRHLHGRLSLNANHYLYARIFCSKFDITAPQARLGNDRLTSWALADELRRRCVVLKRLRARVDSTTRARHADEGEERMPVRQVLFTAYVLLVENQGKNMAQLEDYGRIRDWIREFWFAPHGSSLAIYSIRTGRWPLNRPETSLGMWLFWLLLKPEEYPPGNDSLESPRSILKAMALGAHVYNLTSTSWTEYEPRPGQDLDGITLYSEAISLTPPPLAVPAILSYFALALPSGKVPILPARSTPPSREWDIEWAKCIPTSRRAVTECFRPGSMEGVWEGFFTYTEFEAYAELLSGGPPSIAQRCIVGKHQQTWKLREFHLIDDDSCGSKPGIDAEVEASEGSSLPAGNPLKAYFPSGTQIREIADGLIIEKGDSGETLRYRRPKYSPNDAEGAQPHIRDILITGEGHSSWGQFNLIGRVRPCDGFLSFLKDYSNGARGQWLYRAYLVGNTDGNLAGRWRDTMTPAEDSGYEGCFIMCRRH